MKKIIIVSIVMIMACLTGYVHAQEAPNVQVQLSQPLGPEEDIAQCVLYVSPTCEDDEYGEADRIERIAPLDSGQQNPLSFLYSFRAPDNAETVRCFKTTFIDTSGNESQPSAAVRFRVDKLPPGVPVGLTAVEVQLSQ